MATDTINTPSRHHKIHVPIPISKFYTVSKTKHGIAYAQEFEIQDGGVDIDPTAQVNMSQPPTVESVYIAEKIAHVWRATNK